jgi:tRNA pseudouridine32 synthase / 23S rRNA pseudouridine746 synthase
MYHCPMPEPKVLSAVAAVNAPFAYRPPPDTGLAIVHVDDDLLIVDKPAGLLSVPGRGAERHDSLATRVQQRHPGALIVHRLDMGTSGLLVMARSAAIHSALSRLFAARQVDKRYVAVAAGQLPTGEMTIDLPLLADWPNRPRQMVDRESGKPSLTRLRVIAYDAASDTSRLELRPETGRSHQLRVHLQAIGHPLLGDELYAPPAVAARAPRLLLHATVLAFRHPSTATMLRVESPAPF